MFRTVTLVTDHGITKIGDSRVASMTTETVKINLYHKEGKIGIDVFKLDETKEFQLWKTVYSEWV